MSRHNTARLPGSTGQIVLLSDRLGDLRLMVAWYGDGWVDLLRQLVAVVVGQGAVVGRTPVLKQVEPEELVRPGVLQPGIGINGRHGQSLRIPGVSENPAVRRHDLAVAVGVRRPQRVGPLDLVGADQPHLISAESGDLLPHRFQAEPSPPDANR